MVKFLTGLFQIKNGGMPMPKHQPAGVGMTPSNTELGSFIRARRLELGLRQMSLNQLVPRSGRQNQLTSLLERGKRKFLAPDQLKALAKALQIEPQELRKRMPIKYTAQPKTELGKLIRCRREELGLSLSEFAEKMGTTPRKVKALEVKRSLTIRYALVQPLANALELDSSILAPFVGATRKDTKSELGQLIRSHRKALGMSIGVLAEKLDVSSQFVSQIELGQCCLSENDEMIEKLAQILELDVNELEAVRPIRRLKQMSTTNPLGGFLAEKRLELHLSQREVADRAEINSSVVSGVETGRFRPSPRLLDKLAKVLNCQVPPELIPPPRERSNIRRALGFRTERETALGKFVTTRRLELGLSQLQLAERAGTVVGVVLGIERGTHRLGSLMAEKISKALECEIATELIPAPRPRGRRRIETDRGHLSEQNLSDLEKIKELSDIRVNAEAVGKALKLLRRLLEKQHDGFVIRLHKDKDVVELEFLF